MQVSARRGHSITVIVPVFNEVRHIVENLDLLISEIEDHFESFEILIVSDGSTDGTNFRLFQFKYPGLRLILKPENQGKGAAVRRGFSEAQGDFIFFIDGGMELHPKQLKLFMEQMQRAQADIVIGSKRHPQSKVFYPWYRRVLSWCYQKLVHFLFQIDLTDTQVGMKLFRREVIVAILPDLRNDRYGFDLELLSLAQLRGYGRILEAPVELDYFAKNRRFILTELIHVFRVGLSLVLETLELHRRLRSLRVATPPGPKNSEDGPANGQTN